MTIKQQGGIFGRNPTFNEVESTTISATNDGATVGTFQRNTSDGEILSLKKNSTQVLSIGTNASAADFYFANSTVGFGLMNAAADRVIPTDGTGAATTNQLDLGRNGQSWKNLYVGTGIYFQDSGTVANHLDDYEEGTWTPVIAGGTTAGSNTYTVQNGYYTKIGNRVLINLDIAMSNKDAAMDGTVIITGLPFTPSTATNNAASMAFGRYDNVNLSAGYTQLVAMVQSNGTFLPREVGDNVAAQIIDDAAMSNTSRFQLSGHYFV